MYFSTFEPIDLTLDSVMQQAEVPMLYDSASNQRLPCLYICPVENVLARPPHSVFHQRQHPPHDHRIPHCFKDDPRLGSASANTQRDRGNGSRLYEVNIWMWRYGKGQPLMVSIAEAERIRHEHISESRIRAGEPRKRRS